MCCGRTAQALSPKLEIINEVLHYLEESDKLQLSKWQPLRYNNIVIGIDTQLYVAGARQIGS